MSPDRVIVVADPVGCLSFKRSECRPRAGMDQLFLVSREERFRYGIVVADSRPSQGPPDIVLRAVLVEYGGSVLGGFNRSSQRPDAEELRCESKTGGGWTQRA